MAVVIKIAYFDIADIRTDRIGHHRLERAIAVAEEYANVVVPSIGDNQVEIAVAIEIGNGQSVGRTADLGDGLRRRMFVALVSGIR